MSFEKKFVTSLQTHNRQAFAEFYNTTIDGFWRFLQSRYFLDDNTKDDLIHDYYVKIWRVLPQYNPEYNFETRYRTIFRNHIKDFFKASHEVHDEITIQNIQVEGSQLDRLELDFQKAQLDKALLTLDADSALIVTLRYSEQKEYKEIAAIVGMTESTVRKRLSRSLKALKKHILSINK
jgi:RNA polymerase sigma-70 factor (ECF subfamily)